jgi:hypothetical protein
MFDEPEVGKLIVSGPPGAGKTTAIRALSDSPPITTEVLATDELGWEKEETTVGMDIGQIALDDGEVLSIYGTPGQTRFSFMWDILKIGAQGLILLINHRRLAPMDDLREFASTFVELLSEGRGVVGISRYEDHIGPSLNDYADTLAELGFHVPVFAVDVRERDDVLLLVETLSLLTQPNQLVEPSL